MSLFAAARRAAILSLWLVVCAPALANAPTPTDLQRQAATEVAESLRYGHYADINLDDEWSSRAFQRYLDVLDPQRAYLLRDDVKDFQDLKTSFDEALDEGELERVYALYARYQERLKARLNWLIDRLADGIDFDYKGNERLALNREDEAWARSQAALDQLWQKRLKNAALIQSLSSTEKDDTQHIAKTLRERYENQLSRIEQTNAEDVLVFFMNAVTGTIDPHTEYLSPRQSESFDIQMKLSLEGIGALLQTEGEYVKVASLVPGGPADKGNALEPADRIVAVGQGENGEMVNVVGMRLDEVVDLIRSPKGSTVRLEVIPAKAVDVTRTHTVRITRDTVKLEDQAASSEVVTVTRDGEKHKVGVIDVPTFYVDFDAWQAGDSDYRSSTRDVAKEIEKLKAENVEGIVLDLRSNGGGALQEANSLIGLFIDRGPTVQVRDARGRINLYGDSDQGTRYDGPLTVLVNRLSASASEIFAGAIQDYGRGLVVGTQTFGKGTVQTLSDLSHGQIKLTRAKFYRITGESTQLRGVTPDIKFPSLIDKDDIGESALDNALPWDRVRPVQYRQYGEPQRYLDTLRKRHEKRAKQNPNFVYLKREAALAKQLKEQQTSISLNREQRKREMEAQEAEQLSLENQRRKALGLDQLEDWADARESDGPGQDKEEDEPIDRAQILEAANILLDYAQLKKTQ
ncbi:S41A family C-terminal processing peptidase-1 [Chromohalobacter marismortui]|uniref:S41A family C-terminal processing peptidase-1 n=1 Tax=Chromohalobacter marismortui TaxID=42055 RepID=A0A4R7NWS3_9GAMM|nr:MULTISPECIES: carboxy terminal-processing peptidase [Chromohalobacter]MCI0510454.1 carboxy terminal-processing peptidase [Chromohalobacter sp.]MCI0594193.1 carboxy terminal-processing peptidase [Chromohalobacter sp.]TDU24970.1 S41A family C-terminal processing peptidase-1 [Chromohalobacter marismortui]